MNFRTKKKKNVGISGASRVLLALGILFYPPLVLATRVDARLEMMVQLQNEGPCIASLVGPPTKGCIEWQANVDAAPTLEPSRRLIFTGAADDFLHVVDADTGASFATIKTQGRVVTPSIFSDDGSLLYVGTEKGVLHGFDAYSFAPAFSFVADSKINSDIIVIGGGLVFTSTIGTIYNIDKKTGTLRWQLKRPMAFERLRIAQYSNILFYDHQGNGEKDLHLIVPHADGYLSIVNAGSGELEKEIRLGTVRPNGFIDIVAPMVWFNKKLWVASYDLGIFGIDVYSGTIRDHIVKKEIVQLTTDGTLLFAGSPSALYAISESRDIKWENKITDLKTRTPRAGYPFNNFREGAKRVFFGSPSRLLLDSSNIIMATSAGSIGIFDKATGRLEKILGNSVGFGPQISRAGFDIFMAVSRRGLLMTFRLTGIMVP